MQSINIDDPVIEKHFVLDVNILFSGVLSRKEIYREIFSEYKLYTPDFALLELNKYREIILKKAGKVTPADFRNFTLFIFSKIVVVPDYLISEESFHKAEKLVEDIDKKDVAYVALAEELGIVLLTRDKKLYEGLKEKGYEQVKLFDKLVGDIYGK
ncbi:MAG: PIN domain-containing protein [Candidatus Aminicenantes bacterium]|nr:PIN domain-containing protein [Candidatus Aminicenantes bacterium]